MTEHDVVVVPIQPSAQPTTGFDKGGFQQFVEPNNNRDKEAEDAVFDSGSSGFDTSAWKLNE